MRLLAPLVPAWTAGLWLFATADDLWSAEAHERLRQGDQLAGGWVLVVTLVGGTLVYLLAPLLGGNLAMGTVGSTTAGLGAPNDAQETFGSGLVRAVTLVMVYLLIAGFIALELEGTR